MTMIERIMLRDVDAYDHPLWNGAIAAIARIAAGDIQVGGGHPGARSRVSRLAVPSWGHQVRKRSRVALFR
jgi:hypothetical protein